MTEDTFKSMDDDQVIIYTRALSETVGRMLEMERMALNYLRANPELMAKYIRSLRNG